MDMKKIILIASLFILQACATKLTQQGQQVRLVDKQSDYKCKFVGTVTGSNSMGNNMAHDSQGAMNDMRNNAANIGANAVRLLNIDVNPVTTTALGEALNCDF